MHASGKHYRNRIVRQAAFEAMESRQLMSAAPVAALDYSTYFGDTGSDTAHAIAVDASGNTYVAGSTTSHNNVAVGGYDTTYSGGLFSGDALVAKFGPNGKLIWSTYLGESYELETASSIALDKNGNVYVAGTANSDGWTIGGYDETLGGTDDGFVAKFNNNGQLLWSTYVGGSGDDRIHAMRVTGTGVVTVVGQTDSTDFGAGGFDSTANGKVDGFVTRINANGGHVSTSYIGGAEDDLANDVTMGLDGSLFVVGRTDSEGIASGGYDTSMNGGVSDGFVLQVKPDGTKGWSTYLGGSSTDEVNAIALASDGQLIIGGDTNSAGWISGGYDTTLSSWDAYVMRMTTVGQPVWSTYLGNQYNDSIHDIAVSKDGATIGIVGETGGGTWLTKGPDSTDDGGGSEGFAAQLSSSGQYKWGTFAGGTQIDRGQAVTFDYTGNMLTAGFTQSANWTSGGNDTTFGGDYDAYVARYSYSAPFVSVANGVATIDGTDNADVMVVQVINGQVKVTRNGTTQSVSAAGVTNLNIFAGAGDDNVTVIGATQSYIDGGAGNDLLRGGDAKDNLIAGAGKNTLFGGLGDDRLVGSGGRDFMYGEAGMDRLYGNAGADMLDGGAHIDRCYGGDGDDLLVGGTSNDKLYGEAGNDSFSGGKGADLLFGSAGTDTADTDPTDTRDSIEVLK